MPTALNKSADIARRAMTASLLAGLIVAVCAAAFFALDGMRLRQQLAKNQAEAAGAAEARRLLQALSLDLRSLSSTDKNCKALVEKYQAGFAALGVDIISGATTSAPGK